MLTTQFPVLLDEVNAATVSLRRSRAEVPPDVAALVDSLDVALHAEAPLNLPADPYFASALYAGALRSMKALRHDNVSAQRRDLRVALEQVRHALRDIVGSHWVSDDVPIHEVLEHLVEMLRLPQSDVAHLLGISTRQLQRWLAGDGSTPSGREEARIRMVAQLANQLRHAYTAQGVPAWFDHRIPGLSSTPLDLLDDPVHFPDLMAAARGARGAP
jgi:hypothetical protein